MLDRALQALTLGDAPESTAEAYALRGRVRLDLAAYAAARDDLTLALQLARATGQHAVAASALESLGWAAYHTRDLAQAHAFVERALQEPAVSPTVHVLSGRVLHTRGDLAGAEAALQAAADRPDGAARAMAMSYLGSVVAHQDRYADAIRILDEAMEACRHAGALRALLNALFFGGMARANAGDFGGAQAWFERLAQESEAHDAAYYRPRVANSLAWVWRELGDLVRARDLAEEARERADAVGGGSGQEEPLANAFLALAESALLAEDEAEAARWLGRMDSQLGRVHRVCLALRAATAGAVVADRTRSGGEPAVPRAAARICQVRGARTIGARTARGGAGSGVANRVRVAGRTRRAG
ncbi:MAG: hypothetical protein M3133_03890 [Actinomycetota bacterium]|nr:hypothetical protein [Actinomycetota bacterium]